MGYEETVEEAGGQLIAGATLCRVLWRGSSGIAHGDLWATISIPKSVEVPGAPDGIVHLRVTAGMTSLFSLTAVAFEMTAKAWQLLDVRARGR